MSQSRKSWKKVRSNRRNRVWRGLNKFEPSTVGNKILILSVLFLIVFGIFAAQPQAFHQYIPNPLYQPGLGDTGCVMSNYEIINHLPCGDPAAVVWSATAPNNDNTEFNTNTIRGSSSFTFQTSCGGIAAQKCLQNRNILPSVDTSSINTCSNCASLATSVTPTKTNDLAILFVSENCPSTCPSISSVTGVFTWTFRTSATRDDTGVEDVVTEYYNVSSGIITGSTTVNLSSSTTLVGISVLMITDENTSTPFDVGGVATGKNTAPGATIVTTKLNDLLIGWVQDSVQIFTPAANFNRLNGRTSDPLVIASTPTIFVPGSVFVGGSFGTTQNWAFIADSIIPITTGTNVAISVNPVGDLSEASSKILQILGAWNWESGPVQGVNWGYYLTTNNTIPTHDIGSVNPYNPINDPSVFFVERMQCGGSCTTTNPTIISRTEILNTVGDTIASETSGGCNGSTSTYICNDQAYNPKDGINVPNIWNFLNYNQTQTGSTCTSLTSGAGCSWNINFDTNHMASSQKVPQFKFQSSKFYWGIWVQSGIGTNINLFYNSGQGFLEITISSEYTNGTQKQVDTGGWFGAIGRFLTGGWNNIASSFSSVIGGALNIGNSLTSIFTQVALIMSNIYIILLNGMGSFVGLPNLGTNLATFLSGIATAVVQFFSGLATDITQFVNIVLQIFVLFALILPLFYTFLFKVLVVGPITLVVNVITSLIQIVLGASTWISVILFIPWLFLGVLIFTESIPGALKWLDYMSWFFIKGFRLAEWFADQIFEKIILRIKRLLFQWLIVVPVIIPHHPFLSLGLSLIGMVAISIIGSVVAKRSPQLEFYYRHRNEILTKKREVFKSDEFLRFKNWLKQVRQNVRYWVEEYEAYRQPKYLTTPEKIKESRRLTEYKRVRTETRRIYIRNLYDLRKRAFSPITVILNSHSEGTELHHCGMFDGEMVGIWIPASMNRGHSLLSGRGMAETNLDALEWFCKELDK